MPSPPLPPSPNSIPWNTVQSDPALAAKMLEVLERLEAIDKKLGLLECKCTDKQKKKLRATLKKIAKKSI